MSSFIISLLVSSLLIYALFKWRNGQSIFPKNIRMPKLPKFGKSKRYGDGFGYGYGDDEFRELKKGKQEELDRILDKISRKGIKSLTNEESIFLDKWQG